MLTVYLINGELRVHLGSTAWAHNALNTLRNHGHQVVVTDENGDIDRRSEQEKQKVLSLFDECGI